jgi:hypothetical protein
VPATRRAVFEKIKHLKAAKCPFERLDHGRRKLGQICTVGDVGRLLPYLGGNLLDAVLRIVPI